MKVLNKFYFLGTKKPSKCVIYNSVNNVNWTCIEPAKFSLRADGSLASCHLDNRSTRNKVAVVFENSCSAEHGRLE